MPLTISGRSSVFRGREEYWGADLALTEVSNENRGYWHSASDDMNPWIAFKMPSAEKVAVVEVDDRKDCCQERFSNVKVTVGNSPDINNSGMISGSCGTKSNKGGSKDTYQ